MEITEVRISRRTQNDQKLKGYAAVTFDDVFVVRDLKIIEGKKGLFVAMPSQKIYETCNQCGKKNAVLSRFCNECGHKISQKNGHRRELHRDIAHPVNSDMRAYLQKVILDAYQAGQNDGHDDGADDEISDEEYLKTPKLAESDRFEGEMATAELLDTID